MGVEQEHQSSRSLFHISWQIVGVMHILFSSGVSLPLYFIAAL